MKNIENNKITYSIILLFFIFSAFIIFITRGGAIPFYLFHDPVDSFMDLYNSIEIKGRLNIIGIYPPLVDSFYNILSNVFPSDLWISEISRRENAFNMRNSLAGSYILLMHFSLSLIPIVLLISMDKKRSKKERLLIVFSLVLSGPMLFTLQRGNSIIYAMLFTVLFFYLKDSNSKKLREISLICLAIAANIKYYPAIFILFILQEKRYKEFLHFVLYGALFLFVPMIFFEGGLLNIFRLINNLSGFSGTNHGHIYGSNLNCSISNICLFCYRFFEKDGGSLYLFILLGKILTLITLIIGIWTFYYSKENWEKKASLGLLCILIPSVSYLYSVIFLIPAFLDLNKNNLKLIPAILLGLIFSFYTIPITVKNDITLSFFIVQVCLIILAIYLFGNVLHSKKYYKKL